MGPIDREILWLRVQKWMDLGVNCLVIVAGLAALGVLSTSSVQEIGLRATIEKATFWDSLFGYQTWFAGLLTVAVTLGAIGVALLPVVLTRQAKFDTTITALKWAKVALMELSTELGSYPTFHRDLAELYVSALEQDDLFRLFIHLPIAEPFYRIVADYKKLQRILADLKQLDPARKERAAILKVSWNAKIGGLPTQLSKLMPEMRKP